MKDLVVYNMMCGFGECGKLSQKIGTATAISILAFVLFVIMCSHEIADGYARLLFG